MLSFLLSLKLLSICFQLNATRKKSFGERSCKRMKSKLFRIECQIISFCPVVFMVATDILISFRFCIFVLSSVCAFSFSSLPERILFSSRFFKFSSFGCYFRHLFYFRFTCDAMKSPKISSDFDYSIVDKDEKRKHQIEIERRKKRRKREKKQSPNAKLKIFAFRLDLFTLTNEREMERKENHKFCSHFVCQFLFYIRFCSRHSFFG